MPIFCGCSISYRKNSVLVLFTAKFLAVLRCRAAGSRHVLRLNRVKVLRGQSVFCRRLGGAMSALSPASAPFKGLTSHSTVHQQFPFRIAGFVRPDGKRGFAQLVVEPILPSGTKRDLRHHRVGVSSLKARFLKRPGFLPGRGSDR